jgi:hypothetical protein
MSWPLIVAIIGISATCVVGLREHRKLRTARQALLDSCRGVLTKATLHHGGDGFPRLDGYRNGHFVRVELFPDSMTIRRLPQLWLKLTRIEVRDGLPEFSVLIRPSGTEFYSLTGQHTLNLRPPAGLADEIVARGEGAGAQRLLDAVAPALRRIFTDPRIKEVAVTAKGLRLIWQVAEGERGEHLILRQCQFEGSGVSPDALAARLDDLEQLSAAIDNAIEVRAA